MSAGVINSSILLGLSVVVGFASLLIQTFFWPRDDINSKGSMGVIGELFHDILSTIRVWNPVNREFKSVTFTRMSITFVLMIGLVVVVLATYDSVSSFWIYFVLYLGIGILLVPVLGHILSYIFRSMSRQSSDE